MKFFAPLCFLLTVNTPVLAQPQTPAPSQPNSPPSCAPAQNHPDKENAPLGDRLSDSKGVICPPENRDLGMKAPTPDTATKMPVIKPPADAK